MSIKELFDSELKVINMGLASFNESLHKMGIASIQVDWQPPVPVDEQRLKVIKEKRAEIDKANQKAVDIILRGKPHLIGLEPAIDVIPGMIPNRILHSGPPVQWEQMCGPMKGAVLGGILYEGKAQTIEEAKEMVVAGEFIFSPCHDHQTVGPMAGIVTPSMPVFIVKNEAFGNLAFCTVNEGLGKVLRYGAYNEEVIRKLKWIETILSPTLKKGIQKLKKIDLKHIIAQALHMGDEAHNRNRAGTSLFYRTIAPALISTCDKPHVVSEVLEFINNNDHFFLNLSMPACKATLDAARNVEQSSLIVALSRNGTDFGVQLSGTGDTWYTGPSNVPDALFFPGFTKDDANPDIGDSSITETNGLGGFAIAASPSIVQFVGGSAGDATQYTLQMYEITVAENNVYQIPFLDFRGTPTGIDVTKVIEKSILPFIDTGVAHKEPGIGQIGAGVLNAPLLPFKKAFEGLADQLADLKEKG